LAHMPNAMIVRPSIVFGAEDEFFNRFASLSRIGPVLPVVGADTLFQPVHVDDVAAAVVKGVTGQASGVYALGGPDVKSFRGLMEVLLDVVRRRRLVLNIPNWAAHIMAFSFKIAGVLSLGIIKAPITADQIRSLSEDNVVPSGARGFAELGIKPAAMAAILPDYLWRYRPSGQFNEIKKSAKNLRNT